MKTFKRICINSWETKDGSGNSFRVEKGEEYITSEVNSAPSIGPEPVEDHVIVFSNYWVPVPVNVFAGEEKFT